MIRKDLQKKTDELVQVAYSLNLYTHDDAEVPEADATVKVIEYCYQICIMATAIKAAVCNKFEVQTALANAATLERVCAVERRLNFGKEIYGNQPRFTYTDILGDSCTTELE